jgi:hypothetical protein
MLIIVHLFLKIFKDFFNEKPNLLKKENQNKFLISYG